MIEATMLDLPADGDVAMASSPSYYHGDAMMADYDQPQSEEIDMYDDAGPEYEMADAHVYYEEPQPDVLDAEILDASRVVSPLPAIIDPPAPPPQEPVLEPSHHPLTPGHILTPLSAAVHTAEIDPFSLHSYSEGLHPVVHETHGHSEDDSHLALPQPEPALTHEAASHDPEHYSPPPAEYAGPSSDGGVPPVTEPVSSTHEATSLPREAEALPAHYEEVQAAPETSYEHLPVDETPAYDSETAEPATSVYHAPQPASETHESLPQSADGDAADVEAAAATYDVQDDGDDISNPSDEDLFVAPPPVSLTVQGEDNVHFTLFESLENGVASSSTTFLFSDRLTLYYEPFSAVFQALREHEVFAGRFEYDELALFATQLNLQISEDNKHAQEVTLSDLGLLHDSFGLDGPLQLQLQSITPRFIQRLMYLRAEVTKMMADTGSSSHEADGEQVEVFGHEEPPAETEQAALHAPESLPAGEREPVLEGAEEEAHSSEPVYEAPAVPALAELGQEDAEDQYVDAQEAVPPAPGHLASAEADLDGEADGDFEDGEGTSGDASADYDEYAEYEDDGEYDAAENSRSTRPEEFTDAASAAHATEHDAEAEEVLQARDSLQDPEYHDDPQPATAADITEEGVPEARDDFTALEYDPSSNETASAAEAEPRPADEAPHEETSVLPADPQLDNPEDEIEESEVADAAQSTYEDEAADGQAETYDDDAEGEDYADDQATLSSTDDRPVHTLSSKRSHDELDELDGAGFDEDDHESKRTRVQ